LPTTLILKTSLENKKALTYWDAVYTCNGYWKYICLKYYTQKWCWLSWFRILITNKLLLIGINW
jgi:hypothetical protein